MNDPSIEIKLEKSSGINEIKEIITIRQEISETYSI